MRIIINVDECRAQGGGRTIRLRSHYQLNTADKVAVSNAGMRIYNVLVAALQEGTKGGIFLDGGRK